MFFNSPLTERGRIVLKQQWNLATYIQPVTDKCPPCVTMFLSSPLRFVIISGGGRGGSFLGWWCRWQPLLPPSAVLRLTLTLSASGAGIHLLMGPFLPHGQPPGHPSAPGGPGARGAELRLREAQSSLSSPHRPPFCHSSLVSEFHHRHHHQNGKQLRCRGVSATQVFI